MLVLTRRKGEKINVGDDIVITVLDIKRNQVKIGIDAPEEVDVHRKEIYDRIKDQNLRSTEIERKDIDIVDNLIKKYKR